MFDVYSVRTGFQSVSVAQDLLEILADTAGFRLLGMRLDQSSDAGAAEEELLQVNIKRAAGSFTSGSVGAAVTPGAYVDSAAAAAGVTAERNNTTQAVAGAGTLVTIDDIVWNIRSGMIWVPPSHIALSPDSLFPRFEIGEAAIISITAPTDALTLSCVALIQMLV